jgi:hypothetical protein
MYRSVRNNLAIVALALIVGAVSLWLSRSQSLVDDQDCMRGMIPHHSIAILTSERAGIEDVRVRDLADETRAPRSVTQAASPPVVARLGAR